MLRLIAFDKFKIILFIVSCISMSSCLMNLVVDEAYALGIDKNI